MTAFRYEDALLLVRQQVFGQAPMLPIREVIEAVDVTTLDAGHVLPNMDPLN